MRLRQLCSFVTAAFLAFAGQVQAQTGFGNIPPQTVLGNPTGATAPPTSFAISTLQAQALNVAAINALVASLNLGVQTAGYTTALDGGGASYVGSGAPCTKNAGAGDGVSQILGASATCWLLRDPGDISVKVGGAKCDGTTNDTVRIQATMDRTGAGTSTTIPISASGCSIVSTLFLNFAGSRLHGLGSGSLIVGGQGATDPAFLMIDVIVAATKSEVSGFQLDGKIVSTNVNPTMCPMAGALFPIFGQGIFIEADDSHARDIWVKNTYDNGIGIGRVNCASGAQTNGSPQRVNVDGVICATVGHGSHTGSTHWGGGCVDNLTGNANISNVTDLQSASCILHDFGGGANGNFSNITCINPQVDGAGNNGNCMYSGGAGANFNNLYCLLATGLQAVFVDAFTSNNNYSNFVIAAPAKHAILVKSSTGAGLSPDRLRFTNMHLTDVSFNNSNVGSGFIVDTSAGGTVTNLIVDMDLASPNGVTYNAYGFARVGTGALTGWGKFTIETGISGTYLNIPTSFQVDDMAQGTTAPSVVSCGSGAALTSGNQRSGLIAVGSTNPTTACTLTFGFFGWANPADCVFTMRGGTPVTLGITSRAWTSGGANYVISAASTIHGQQIAYICR